MKIALFHKINLINNMINNLHYKMYRFEVERSTHNHNTGQATSNGNPKLSNLLLCY